MNPIQDNIEIAKMLELPIDDKAVIINGQSYSLDNLKFDTNLEWQETAINILAKRGYFFDAQLEPDMLAFAGFQIQLESGEMENIVYAASLVREGLKPAIFNALVKLTKYLKGNKSI